MIKLKAFFGFNKNDIKLFQIAREFNPKDFLFILIHKIAILLSKDTHEPFKDLCL